MLCVQVTCHGLVFALLFHVGASQHTCACKGKRATHGYCGYHLNVMSNERRPWCRTLDGCGQAGMLGTWSYCDERGVERRYHDGQWLTSKQFSDYYGTRGKQLYMSSSYKEQRKANNGMWYTVHEFRDFYFPSEGERGWVERWTSAQQRSWKEYGHSSDTGHYGHSSEQRQARDGKWYTWREFQSYYGHQATEMWNSAVTSGGPTGRSSGYGEQRQARDGKWYTWREFQNYYGHQATEMWNFAGRSDL